MAHGRDKPGREKRKPKKDKPAGKTNQPSDGLHHIPSQTEQR
ncbi:MAG TPA: hypothetical protein VFA18_20200 [Gemmataceae bacterium]|nr:hypothetical protein [Gemmataceae bacterium]